MTFGWRILGLSVVAFGVLGLVWGDFGQGQPVPKDFPNRAAFAYAAAAFMLVAGAGMAWRRTAAWSAAALLSYYAVVVVILMNGRVLIKHYAEYVAYSGAIAEPLAIAAGALIVFAANARIEPALASRITRVGQVVFGFCAVLFGGAHFVYLNLTAPLVPQWLPPDQTFWAYATGMGHIAAGVAILAGVQARLGAVLLTVMYAAFAMLVWVPLLHVDPSSYETWTESVQTLALTGVAWVVADSLGRRTR